MATPTPKPRIPPTTLQKKVLVALAATVGLRMLGLFLVLPVFTLYGLQFTSSRFLVGFAFGCYGLTMAILQIPFGRLSDRIRLGATWTTGPSAARPYDPCHRQDPGATGLDHPLAPSSMRRGVRLIHQQVAGSHDQGTSDRGLSATNDKPTAGRAPTVATNFNGVGSALYLGRRAALCANLRK